MISRNVFFCFEGPLGPETWKNVSRNHFLNQDNMEKWSNSFEISSQQVENNPSNATEYFFLFWNRLEHFFLCFPWFSRGFPQVFIVFPWFSITINTSLYLNTSTEYVLYLTEVTSSFFKIPPPSSMFHGTRRVPST